jgi:hypothetical protein
MSDQELAQAMRDLIARHIPGARDARQVAADVMRRDRREVWLLAACAIFLWLLAGAGLLFLLLGRGAYYGFPLEAGTIVSLLLAPLFTILASRRATLRQINISLMQISVSLMEISEQLKQLRRPPPGV